MAQEAKITITAKDIASAAFKRFGAAVRRATARLKTFKASAGRLGTFLRNKLLAAIVLVSIAMMAIGRLFGAMRESLDEVGESASDTADNLAKAATKSEQAADKMKATFGAFGKVGAGFVQMQAKVLGKAEEAGKKAVKTAEKVKKSMGGATVATSRFGKALDRISAAWARAKKVIFAAIAKAITPALEKLADLMESPEFEEFIRLLADDLAKIVTWIAEFIIDTLIPAFQEWMAAVEKAGGPVEWLKKKWWELKETVLKIIAIIIGKVLILSNAWRSIFESMAAIVVTAFLGIQMLINDIIEAIKEKIWAMLVAIQEALAALGIEVELPTIPDVQRAAGGGITETRGGGTTIINVTVPPGTENPTAFGESVGNSIILALRSQGMAVPV